MLVETGADAAAGGANEKPPNWSSLLVEEKPEVVAVAVAAGSGALNAPNTS